MDSELEVGYLTRLFTEPVYLMGYETTQRTTSMPTNSIATKNQPDPVALSIAPTSVLKEEVKKIPSTPVLQTLATEKILKKCILLFLSEADELKANELEFLSKIMKACGVLPNEYECVNFRGITINDLSSRYSYTKLVLFGVKIPGLVINQYKCTQVRSTQLISADDVWMVESNVSLKKQLWEQLQAMFGLVK